MIRVAITRWSGQSGGSKSAWYERAMKLAHLSNDEVMAQLTSICAEGNRLLARLIAMLVEVEERRLHLELACSSMLDFCTRKLGLSEGAAVRRLVAARLVKRFPQILGRIARGEIHLSALQMLAPHFTAANVEVLIDGAAHKSKAEVEELRARIAPSSDVLPTIRTLTPPPADVPIVDRVSSPEPASKLAPLSATRHELRLTVSTAQREKLERARDLMRHANVNGDLATVLERGLDLLIAKLEKERLGKVARPRRQATKPKDGRISRAVRRQVFERDGSRCTFLSESGERCPGETLLELDHIEPRALGGHADADNLRVRCRAHNRLHAEHAFGKGRVARAIHLRQQRRAATNDEATPMQETLRMAERGLTHMGFQKAEARRALDSVVARRPPGASAPVQDVLREVLALLS
jgi:5-methylcytosine-specific restriction endonuclease McrA